MGFASYAIIATEKGWGILHDGDVEGEFTTKEAAFESAVAAASLAIRQGHEVHVSVPSKGAAGRANIGGASARCGRAGKLVARMSAATSGAETAI